MTPSPSASPYLSARQAIRPAIFAHQLLAGDQEKAGKLAAECNELLRLTRELVKAAGYARILGEGPADVSPEPVSDLGDLGDRRARLVEAYADAATGWAKVVGGLVALGGALLDLGAWDDVRRLASVLQDAGEGNAAADLRARLGKSIWDTYHDQLRLITSRMTPADIASSLRTLQAVLLEVPEDFPDRDREVNRLLVPLATAIHELMKTANYEIPYDSRVQHIASGGVARYPDIVKTSLDELSAEFAGISGEFS